MTDPDSPSFSFSVEHATTIPDKGIFVTGQCRGGPARVGDRVEFADPEGGRHDLRVLSVVGRVTDDDGQVIEGRSGLVLEEIERKLLRPPVVLAGYAQAAG